MPKYSEQLVDDSGYRRPIAGASVFLLNADGTLATTTSPNPVLTDDFGAFSFIGNDGVYSFDARIGGVTIAKGTAIIGTPPQYVGPQGQTGPANSSYATLAAMKAAPNTNLTYILTTANGPVTYAYVAGNFTGKADDVNVVALNGTPVATGALVRQVSNSVTYDTAQSVQGKLDRLVYVTDARFAGGAKADDGTNDTPAIQAANNYLAALGGGTMVFPAGTFLMNTSVTLHPRVSIQGTGNHQTVIQFAADGFITTAAAADNGLTVFSNFRMIGAGRTIGTAIACAMDTANSRIQGIRFRDIQIEACNVGIQMRSAWDTRIEGCRITNVTYGVRYEGQCVSPTITGSQIISLGSAYGDGSVGVYADQYAYTDNVTRRPEAVLIDGETRIFGFDTNVWLNRALVGSVVNSDIDGALQYAIRVATVDYKCVITNNYLATIHDTRGTTIVRVDALAVANDSLVSIRDNSFSAAGVYTAASTGVQINGANRTGKLSIRDNNIGQGAGIGTAIYLNTAQNVDIVKNNIIGQVYSINKENFGGHLFERNTINGPIRRVGVSTSGGSTPNPDRFVENTGTAVTGYVGLVTIPASQTTVTISLSSLGLPTNPVVGSPANLIMIAKAQQISGSATRGPVRAYYDGAGNVVVSVTNAFAQDSSDVNLELTAQ